MPRYPLPLRFASTDKNTLIKACKGKDKVIGFKAGTWITLESQINRR